MRGGLGEKPPGPLPAGQKATTVRDIERDATSRYATERVLTQLVELAASSTFAMR